MEVDDPTLRLQFSMSNLEGIHIAQSVLYMAVHHELCQSQNLSTQMESVTKTTLLSLFGGQRLDRLQVEVVVQMEIVEVLTMNEQVEHVIALSTYLQAHLHPV